MEKMLQITPDKALAELEMSEHKAWEQYEPEFLAEGSERVVFTIPEHPDVVVKVSKHYLSKALRMHSAGLEVNFAEVINELTTAEGELRAYFGTEHVPASRYVLITIPVLPFMQEQVDDVSVLPECVQVVAQVQQKVETSDFDHLYSLSGFFADPNDEAYVEAAMQGLFPTATNVEVSEILRFKTDNTEIQEILHALPESHDVIKDFVRRAIEYSNATGRNLDTMGPGNVIITKQENTWNYQLVDALFATTDAPWLETIKAKLQTYLENPNLVEKEIDTIGPQIVLVGSYFRFVNGLATHLDMPDRLDYFNNEVNAENIDQFKDLLLRCRQAWKPYSRTPNQALASHLNQVN